MQGNLCDEEAGVSRGHISLRAWGNAQDMVKGRTCVSREEPSGLDMAMKPTGGVCGRRVAGRPDPDENLLERSIFAAGWDILGYRNTIVQFRKSTTGCGGGCACAI